MPAGFESDKAICLVQHKSRTCRFLGRYPTWQSLSVWLSPAQGPDQNRGADVGGLSARIEANLGRIPPRPPDGALAPGADRAARRDR
jgi:hypothetical protein